MSSQRPKNKRRPVYHESDDLMLEELHQLQVEKALETLALDCLRHGDAETVGTVYIDGGAYDVKFTITINPDKD